MSIESVTIESDESAAIQSQPEKLSYCEADSLHASHRRLQIPVLRMSYEDV